MSRGWDLDYFFSYEIVYNYLVIFLSKCVCGEFYFLVIVKYCIWFWNIFDLVRLKWYFVLFRKINLIIIKFYMYWFFK